MSDPIRGVTIEPTVNVPSETTVVLFAVEFGVVATVETTVESVLDAALDVATATTAEGVLDAELTAGVMEPTGETGTARGADEQAVRPTSRRAAIRLTIIDRPADGTTRPTA
jgi:hypothetical protein